MIVNSEVLENGLRVIVVNWPKSKLLNVGLFVRQGARNENESTNGVSHFLEHMLGNTQRATRLGKSSVKTLLSVGGLVNAHTTKEYTSYECSVLSEHFDLSLQVLYDLVFQPNLSPEEVELERRVILAELARKLSSANQLIEHFAQGVFSSTGYGNWILGSKETIEQVTSESLQILYEETYVADNMSIVIVTDLESRDVIHRVAERFGDVLSGIPNPIEIPMLEAVGLKVLRQPGTPQLSFCLGGIGPSSRDESSLQYSVGITSWGTIPNCRFFEEVRDRRGLVYSLQSFYHSYIQTGIWGVAGTVEKKNFAELMNVIGHHIHNARSHGLQEDEISSGISMLKTAYLTEIQQQKVFMNMIGKNAIFSNLIYPNDAFRQFALATLDVIKGLFYQYIQPTRLSIVVLGDVDSEAVLEYMTKIGDLNQ